MMLIDFFRSTIIIEESSQLEIQSIPKRDMTDSHEVIRLNHLSHKKIKVGEKPYRIMIWT